MSPEITHPDWLLLTASEGRPSAQLLATATGERTPLPLGLDDSHGFGYALSREGWVIVQIPYQVVALRDGDLLHPARLPDAWTAVPAADEQFALLTRFFGGSSRPGEDVVVELVDQTGQTLRTLSAPMAGNAIGELASGHVVARDAIWSWDGQSESLPGPGEPVAVLSGQYVVMKSERAVTMIDTVSGAFEECAVPEGMHLLRPNYGRTSERIAFIGWRQDGIIVVTTDRGPRYLEVGFPQRSAAWIDDDHVLAIGGPQRVLIDVETGHASPVVGLPKECWVQLCVTGRFDTEPLRSALRPTRRPPYAAMERAEMLRAERVRLEAVAAMPEVDASILALVAPAVRIRSCIPPRRMRVGASRLGGRPDLPLGHQWPEAHGRPMTFLAQLRLDEVESCLPGNGLGDRGLLLVFVLFAEDGAYLTEESEVHAEIVDPDSLRRAAWPRALPDELRFEPAIAVPEPTLTVPTTDASDWLPESGPRHQIFGHRSAIQDWPDPAGQVLLLQLDGDALMGTSFGDGGTLLVWCPAKRVRGGRVDGCTVESESY